MLQFCTFNKIRSAISVFEKTLSKHFYQEMLAKDAVRFYYTGDILHISFILGFEIFYIIAMKKNLLGKKPFSKCIYFVEIKEQE